MTLVVKDNIETRGPLPTTAGSSALQANVSGRDALGAITEVQLVPDGSAALNPAFDVTPARLVSGLITEHGVLAADEAVLRTAGRR
jgi:methylthioribose-1-phosphate isomerase